jgi:hypothetical protein
VKRAKYVIIGTATVDVPIVFPEFASHSDVARAMAGDSWSERVLSAGFVDFGAEISDGCGGRCEEEAKIVVECYGKSVTLDKKPRPEDARMIARALGMEKEVCG